MSGGRTRHVGWLERLRWPVQEIFHSERNNQLSEQEFTALLRIGSVFIQDLRQHWMKGCCGKFFVELCICTAKQGLHLLTSCTLSPTARFNFGRALSSPHPLTVGLIVGQARRFDHIMVSDTQRPLHD